MVASRRRPKGGLVTPFGLGILTFIVAPSAIGSQDLAALVARQPILPSGRLSRFSLVGTAHGATFTMPRPMSAAMPVALSYTLAGLDTSYADITGSIRERLLGEVVACARRPRIAGSEPAAQGQPSSASGARASNLKRPRASMRRRSRHPTRAEPAADGQRTFQLASVDRTASPPSAPGVADVGAPEIVAPEHERGAAAEFADSLAIGIAFTREEADPAVLMARLYFGGEPMGRDARSGSALAGRRGAQSRDAGGLRRYRGADHVARARSAGRRPASVHCAAGLRRRNHRQQGRGHRRGPSSDVAGRAARPHRRDRAQSRSSASPRGSISSRAASRCAARSRSRR